jgi:predicted amidohydrolase YtcJ
MFTIYEARRIVTMNPSNPVATHVAVQDGRILGVGAREDLASWGEHRLDERFADKILLPGFVEGHSHAIEGTFWRSVYCGAFDRRDPDGRVWPGLGSVDAVLDRLSTANARMADPVAPLSGWALDPIHLDGTSITREQLDAVSRTRPIGVMHASVHILNVNSRALELAGLLRQGIRHPGVPLAPDGLPTGELRGPDAYGPAARHVGFSTGEQARDDTGLRQFARLCVRHGVTTATDLANPLTDEAVAVLREVTEEPDFPVRIVPFLLFQGVVPDTISRARLLGQTSSDRLRISGIKIVVDGSIQGFTARLRWPGYLGARPKGLWYVNPDQLGEALEQALAQDVLVHLHVNGDEATELVLDLMERALAKHPRPDHRFTLQHCQLADAAQFRRMKALGLCANLFINHVYYWGEQHRAATVGPERAARMNACATALASGVPLAIHSDAPVTPLNPLFTAWCAVNRATASGRILGVHERIDRLAALRAVTLGAAHTLKLDDEIGSIECGKRADFAVLEEDPTEVDEANLKDIGVWGTVQGGRVFPAADT